MPPWRPSCTSSLARTRTSAAPSTTRRPSWCGTLRARSATRWTSSWPRTATVFTTLWLHWYARAASTPWLLGFAPRCAQLRRSGSPFVRGLFTEPEAEAEPLAAEATPSSSRLRTLAAQFHAQLTRLYERLAATEAHFVRCIKPNANKVGVAFLLPPLSLLYSLVGWMSALHFYVLTSCRHAQWPDYFEPECVLQQQRYLGLHAALLVRRSGALSGPCSPW